MEAQVFNQQSPVSSCGIEFSLYKIRTPLPLLFLEEVPHWVSMIQLYCVTLNPRGIWLVKPHYDPLPV
jgi:hypothetical protein